jgi:hypothetical protein
MENKAARIVICLILVLLSVFSALFVADKASAVETHQARIQSIDEKIDTVLKLTASTTLASAGVSAIPGDTATPIAEKLADFTEYFLVILCVLYSEKYLLTILGLGVFRFLIPCAAVLFIIGMFWRPELMKKLGIKIFAFAIAIYLAIPISLKVSDMIYSSFSEQIETTISSAEELNEDTAALTTEDEGLISSILNRISETASSLTRRASETLNHFVETLAVLIVTSCVIPILVLLLIIWMVKLLTGIDISIPAPRPRRHDFRTKPDAQA